MIVYLEISAASRRAFDSHKRLAGRFAEIADAALEAAAAAGADRIGELLLTNQLQLKTRRGGMGIAGAVTSWRLGQMHCAIGVPAESPAHAYAGIQAAGGTIRARPGKALAIPVNEQARQYTSPRDVPVELTLIQRKGRPPLLAQVLADHLVIWYVLKKSVTLRATHWLSDGIQQSLPVMRMAFQARLDEKVQEVIG